MNNKYEALQGRYTYTSISRILTIDKRKACTHDYLNAPSMFDQLDATTNVNQYPTIHCNLIINKATYDFVYVVLFNAIESLWLCLIMVQDKATKEYFLIRYLNDWMTLEIDFDGDEVGLVCICSDKNKATGNPIFIIDIALLINFYFKMRTMQLSVPVYRPNP